MFRNKVNIAAEPLLIENIGYVFLCTNKEAGVCIDRCF